MPCLNSIQIKQKPIPIVKSKHNYFSIVIIYQIIKAAEFGINGHISFIFAPCRLVCRYSLPDKEKRKVRAT